MFITNILNIVLLVTPLVFGDAKECFKTREELRRAAVAYVEDNGENTSVAQTYGWPIGKWCVGDLRDFRGIFSRLPTFNEDISEWNMTKGKEFVGMFYKASSFNQPTNWKNFVPIRVIMMFTEAKSFNQDLSSWVMSGNTDFTQMFYNASSFNGNVSNWKFRTDKVWMADMFRGAVSFTGDLSAWEVPERSFIDGIFKETSYDGAAPFCSTTKCLQGSLQDPPECPNPSRSYVPPGRELTMILPKFFALASLLGSGYIAVQLAGTAKARQVKLKDSFFRLLFGLSAFDMISSFGYFFTSWALPKDPPQLYTFFDIYDDRGYVIGDSGDYCYWQRYWDRLFPYASGTMATCTVQGFFIHIGTIGSIMFTGSFALNCLLTVKYNWREQSLRKLEKRVIPFHILLAVGSGIYLAAIGQFNPLTTGFCWIAPYPWILEYHPGKGISYPENKRGEDNWFWYRIFFGQLEVGLVLLIILFSMGSVYLYVRQITKRNRRYAVESRIRQTSRSEEGRRDSSRLSSFSMRGSVKKISQAFSAREMLVFTKGMLYVGAFLVVYIPVVAAQSMDIQWPYLDVIITSLLSCQGMLDILIYAGKMELLFKICAAPFRAGKILFQHLSRKVTSSRTDSRTKSDTKDPQREEEKEDELIAESQYFRSMLNMQPPIEEVDPQMSDVLENWGESHLEELAVKDITHAQDDDSEMPGIQEAADRASQEDGADQTATAGCFETSNLPLWSTCPSNVTIDA